MTADPVVEVVSAEWRLEPLEPEGERLLRLLFETPTPTPDRPADPKSA